MPEQKSFLLKTPGGSESNFGGSPLEQEQEEARGEESPLEQ